MNLLKLIILLAVSIIMKSAIASVSLINTIKNDVVVVYKLKGETEKRVPLKTNQEVSIANSTLLEALEVGLKDKTETRNVFDAIKDILSEDLVISIEPEEKSAVASAFKFEIKPLQLAGPATAAASPARKAVSAQPMLFGWLREEGAIHPTILSLSALTALIAYFGKLALYFDAIERNDENMLRGPQAIDAYNQAKVYNVSKKYSEHNMTLMENYFKKLPSLGGVAAFYVRIEKPLLNPNEANFVIETLGRAYDALLLYQLKKSLDAQKAAGWIALFPSLKPVTTAFDLAPLILGVKPTADFEKVVRPAYENLTKTFEEQRASKDVTTQSNAASALTMLSAAFNVYRDFINPGQLLKELEFIAEALQQKSSR